MSQAELFSQGIPKRIQGSIVAAFLRLLAWLLLIFTFCTQILRPDSLAAMILVPPGFLLVIGAVITAIAGRCALRTTTFVSTIFWLWFAIGYVETLPAIVRSLFVPAASNSHKDGSRIRIISWNCDSQTNCALELKPFNPDVVLLQEAPGQNELAAIATELFGDSGSYLSNGETAILARGNLEAVRNVRGECFTAAKLSLPHGILLKCISLRLAPPVSRIDFWDGGFWRDHKSKRYEHLRQLKSIVSCWTDTDSNSLLIVGGDFNTTPRDPALNLLRPTLQEAFYRSGRGWGGTGTNDFPLFRVDQIWISQSLIPMLTSSIRSKRSDHRIVVCDAVLRDKNAP